MADAIRLLLDRHGEGSAKLLEKVRPLIANGRTSEALIAIAQALESAAENAHRRTCDGFIVAQRPDERG